MKSLIYLEPVALRTVQLVNVECLALTRAHQASRRREARSKLWTAVSSFGDEYPSCVSIHIVYVIATPLVCSRGSEHPGEDHGVSQLASRTFH